MKYGIIFLSLFKFGCTKSDTRLLEVKANFISIGHFAIPIDRDGTTVYSPYAGQSVVPIDGDKLVVEQKKCGGTTFTINFLAKGSPMYADSEQVTVISSSVVKTDSDIYYSVPNSGAFEQYVGPLHRLRVESQDLACALEWFESHQTD